MGEIRAGRPERQYGLAAVQASYHRYMYKCMKNMYVFTNICCDNCVA